MPTRSTSSAPFYTYSSKRNLRQEEIAAYRRITIATFLIVGLLVGGYFWGIPLLSRLGTNSSSIPIDTTTLDTADHIPPTAPNLDSQADATKVKTLTVTGSAESGSTITISDNDQIQATTLADNTGVFSAAIKLVGGTNTITATATDKAKNVSKPSHPLTIIYDATPPKLTISSPTDSQTTSSTSTLVVSGKTDPTATISINDRQAIVQSDGTFSLSLTLSAGQNTITFIATDQAGNTQKATRTITYSTGATDSASLQ